MRQIENADASLIEAGLSIRDHLDLKEGQLRDDIAKKITRAFIIVNLGVLILILLGAILDHWFIAKQLIKGTERLITTPLLMSVIGATTVQLGAIALAMSNWLFPKIRGRS